jgi:glycosyltransferase involved in cell wall biosynthesis
VRVALFSNQFAAAVGHGIKRYSHELYEALRDADGVTAIPVAGWSSLETDELAALQARTGLELTGLGRRGTSLFWTFLDAPVLESRMRVRPDIVHAASLGYPVATRKPFVVTIHDLGPLTHPEYFSNTRPWVMERSLQQAVRKADAIVCVSQSTANEVADYAGPAVEGRLHVVLEGVGDEFFSAVAADCLSGLAASQSGRPFILCAGKLSPRKNVVGTLRALGRVRDRLPDHDLVLVGGDGWDVDHIAPEIERCGLSGRVHQLGYVSNEQLRALYQRTHAYLHPSLYEGFGLTVLEAMASGAPVITSDRTSLPEVAGEAACLVDPENIDAIADAIERVCGDDNLRETMSAAGRSRARMFTWSGAADRMKTVYQSLLRDPVR